MSDQKSLPGIHHVTAITADVQANIDFYCGVLGLRLVKLTVNFDDPGSYHLYYGDELGRPGTIMTFFAWPGAHRGRIGPPQVTVTAFAVPAEAIDFWIRAIKKTRCANAGVRRSFRRSRDRLCRPRRNAVGNHRHGRCERPTVGGGAG